MSEQVGGLRRVALIVGIDAYEELGQLNNAVNDAELIKVCSPAP